MKPVTSEEMMDCYQFGAVEDGGMTSVRWFEQHRQDWIAETIRVFGWINRCHIERKFGLSTPQASLDLKKFMANNPGRIIYDKSAKQYVREIVAL